MPRQKNKEIVGTFYWAVLGRGNVAAINDLVAVDFVDHNPFPGQSPGRDGLRQSVRLFHTPFPDIQVSVDDLIAEGDRVAARWTARGTHAGEFLGIAPTGRQVMIKGVDIFRLAGGRIAERWGHQDELGLIQELGVLPALAMTGR